MTRNQTITAVECQAIRKLADFDLEMFVSELEDHGWLWARALLRMMPDVKEMFDDEKDVHVQAAEAEPQPKQAKSSPFWKMLSQLLGWGGMPMLVIASKRIGDHKTPFVDYAVASELKQEDVLYVLRRVTGLMDGTIKRQVEQN
jgi:hypothetical protein